MIGVVVVTHGGLADEFVSAVEHVVGPQEQMRAVGIASNADVDLARQRIIESTEEVDEGHGVVILSDMFGGTPSNLAMSLLDRPLTEVIAGVNLPTLIKLAEMRHSNDLGKAVTEAAEAGRKYIQVASELLGK